jgi:hypothetical protein
LDVLRRVKNVEDSPYLYRLWATRERSQKPRMRTAMLMMAAASRSCLRTPKLCQFSPSNWRSAMAVFAAMSAYRNALLTNALRERVSDEFLVSRSGRSAAPKGAQPKSVRHETLFNFSCG